METYRLCFVHQGATLSACKLTLKYGRPATMTLGLHTTETVLKEFSLFYIITCKDEVEELQIRHLKGWVTSTFLY